MHVRISGYDVLFSNFVKGPRNRAVCIHVEDEQKKKEARLVLRDLILGSRIHLAAVASVPGSSALERKYVYVWRAWYPFLT